MPFSFGKISYINCLPLFFAGDRAGFKFISACPADLNAAVRAGGLDASFISRWEYLDSKISDSYKIIPEFCIAGDGEIMSVELFSKRPVEDLAGGRIFITNETGTSSRAFRYLIKRKYGFDIFKLERSVGIDSADAVLLIGNAALSFNSGTSFPFKTDLGEMWREQTGMKMIYSVAVARNDVFSEIAPLAESYFEDSIRLFRENMDEACSLARRQFAESQACDISAEKLRKYYTKLLYRLDPREFSRCLNFVSENGEF